MKSFSFFFEKNSKNSTKINRMRGLKYNNRMNIKQVINKSADLKQRIIDCNESINLNFYNPFERIITRTPEVLPFKYFRQKRFLKINKQSIAKLKEVFTK